MFAFFSYCSKFSSMPNHVYNIPYLIQVSNLLVTVNSSVNLFIYCVFGTRFRNELKKLLRPLLRKVTKNGLCCLLSSPQHISADQRDQFNFQLNDRRMSGLTNHGAGNVRNDFRLINKDRHHFMELLSHH